MKALEFWGLHCAPCEKISQFIDEIVAVNPSFEIEKVAVHENLDLAMKFMVKSVPTLVIIDGESILYKGNVGGLSKIQLIDLIEKYA